MMHTEIAFANERAIIADMLINLLTNVRLTYLPDLEPADAHELLLTGAHVLIAQLGSQPATASEISRVIGRPRDVVGLKAMAIFAQRAFQAFRPGGVRIHAGAPVIEQGMVEEDFKDLAAAGVTMLGEVGLGSVKDGATARQMVAWRRRWSIIAPRMRRVA